MKSKTTNICTLSKLKRSKREKAINRANLKISSCNRKFRLKLRMWTLTEGFGTSSIRFQNCGQTNLLKGEYLLKLICVSLIGCRV